jgi:hypothetical protein
VPSRVWWVFGLFCFVSGSRWLVEEAVPAPMPLLPREALHHAVLMIVFGALAVRREKGRSKTLLQWLAVAGAATLVFVLPDVVIAGATGKVASLTITLVFMLVPVVVVFIVAQQASSFGVDDGVRGLLGPAIAGAAGAALMLPFTLPVSTIGRVWLTALIASAVLAGAGAVWMHTLLKDCGVWRAAAVACCAIAIVAGVTGWADWQSVAVVDGQTALVELAIALLFDGGLLLIAVWLLREMAPVGFASRYLLVLLVAVIESFVLLRPNLSWYIAAGVALMAVASTLLLRAAAKADSEGSLAT